MRKLKHGKMSGGCGDSCCLKLEGLNVRIQGEEILEDVSFHLHCGEITALIGPNGAGKSTLFRSILGQLPYSGSITFAPAGGPAIRLADGTVMGGTRPLIGYVPQNMVFDRSTPMTVADMLCANLSAFPIWLGHKKEKLARADAMLQKVGGKNLLQKRLGSLSGGEMQRVLLAFALEPMPDMLLLDEPVSAVDRKGIEVFYDLVTSLRSEYHMPVILVSHDLSHVARYATRAALLDRTILVSGDVKTVIASPQVRETFGLDVVGGARA